MLRLRPFKQIDAKTILGWIHTETDFRKWSADRYEQYPAVPDDMIRMYLQTEQTADFFPMTAFDESGVVGHMILRFTDPKTIRFGFVIVDAAKRGKGYGKAMLQLAIRYAKEFLGAEMITLGVFENNEAARYCYEAVGFREIAMQEEEYFEIQGEKWKCIEMKLV